MVLLKNPTDKVIMGLSRVDDKWFDGIFPDDVLNVESEADAKVLIKKGCVVIEDVEPSIEDKIESIIEVEGVELSVPKKRGRRKKIKEVN